MMRNLSVSSHWRDILALLILVFGISLFHARGLAPGQVFLPVDLANSNLPWTDGTYKPLQNWLISDPLYEFYPFMVHNVNSLRQDGSWPLWNPDIFLGHPVIADPLMLPFYPAYMGLGLLFGPARGFTLGLWLHALLASFLTYGLLRTLSCTRQGATLGAFTYALSGYMVTWFETHFWINTLSWLPGVLWAFVLAIRGRRWSYVALTGLLLSFAILGGQFQFIVTFSLFFGLIALGRTIELARKERKWQIYLWPLLVLALSMSLGVLLSAILIVPFAELLNMSKRVVSQGLHDPLPIQQLITLLVPNFYGIPVNEGAYWGSSNYSEATIYAGVISLLLATIAPFTTRRFSTIYLFLAGLAVIYFIVGGPGIQSLGSIPGLKYASLHRSAFILPLIVAWLAAKALSEPKISVIQVVIATLSFVGMIFLAYYLNLGEAQAHWSKIQVPFLHAIAFLCAAFILLFMRFYAKDLSDWGLVALVFVDLFLIGHRFNPTGPIANLMPVTPAIEYLQANTGQDRVMVLQKDGRMVFGPNVASIFALAETGGYTSSVSKRLHQLVSVDDPEIEIPWTNRSNVNMILFSNPSDRLLDLLGVKYVLSGYPKQGDIWVGQGDGVIAEQLVEGCDATTNEITASNVVSGSFVVQKSRINRLDARFQVSQPEQREGRVIIRLWRGSERQQLIMEHIQEAITIENEQNVTIYFAPEIETPNQSYVWEVSALEDQTGVQLCTNEVGQPAISIYGMTWSEVYQGEIYIFERLAPLPRARVVYAAEAIADDHQAITRVLDHKFDIHNVAVTASTLDLPSQAALPATSATIVEYTSTEVVIQASAIQPGLLVLSDSFHPGWKAYVDGKPATIHRTNHILRGVLLSQGTHEVVFRFEPFSLRIGAVLSTIGVMTLLFLVFLDKRFKVSR